MSEKTRKNILICDERGEISSGEFGESCDVIEYCSKKVGFTAGIRAMRPEIIITDEISVEDFGCLKQARDAGVIVIASAHFSDIEYVEDSFKNIFEKIVLLDDQQIGKVKAIYNGYD